MIAVDLILELHLRDGFIGLGKGQNERLLEV